MLSAHFSVHWWILYWWTILFTYIYFKKNSQEKFVLWIEQTKLFWINVNRCIFHVFTKTKGERKRYLIKWERFFRRERESNSVYISLSFRICYFLFVCLPLFTDLILKEIQLVSSNLSCIHASPWGFLGSYMS